MKKTKAEAKISKVYKEFKAGTLHSGKGGPVVKKPKQAIAIGKPKAMPTRGGRTTTNMMKKSGRGK
jgi:hypothetical protein